MKVFSLKKFIEDCKKDHESEETIQLHIETWAGRYDGREVYIDHEGKHRISGTSNAESVDDWEEERID